MTADHPLTPDMPAKWATALANLITKVGRDQFPNALHQVLKLCCDFDAVIVFRYDQGAPPVALHHDLDEIRAAIAVAFYASGPYLLDPFYRACQSETQARVFRLTDLAPEAFYRSEYYRVFYRKAKVRDELGILVPDGPDHWLAISLTRSSRSTNFDEADCERMQAVLDILSAAMRRQWGQGGSDAQDRAQDGWDMRMRSFGANVLSPREQEVVHLILLGHSSPSAAAYLGIAEGTVKVHRHHAYAKLGISSQAELFSLASRHMNMGP